MKVDPASGVALRKTRAPVVKLAEQVVPQLMPGGDEVTVPLPPPILLTVSPLESGSKWAITVLAASTVTAQAPVPVHAPDQPVKVDAVSGVAVRRTNEPLLKLAEQVAPQVIPKGDEVTVPAPAPALLTVRVHWAAKFAVTVLARSMVRAQVVVPVHAPDQPVNADPKIRRGGQEDRGPGGKAGAANRAAVDARL